MDETKWQTNHWDATPSTFVILMAYDTPVEFKLWIFFSDSLATSPRFLIDNDMGMVRSGPGPPDWLTEADLQFYPIIDTVVNDDSKSTAKSYYDWLVTHVLCMDNDAAARVHMKLYVPQAMHRVKREPAVLSAMQETVHDHHIHMNYNSALKINRWPYHIASSWKSWFYSEKTEQTVYEDGIIDPDDDDDMGHTHSRRMMLPNQHGPTKLAHGLDNHSSKVMFESMMKRGQSVLTGLCRSRTRRLRVAANSEAATAPLPIEMQDHVRQFITH